MKSTLIPLLALLLAALMRVDAWAAGEATNRLSERTHRQLSRVHELMQQRGYDEALAGLDRLRPRVKHKRHAQALLLQTYAYLFANTEQYRKAVDALSQSLALEALPPPATERSLYVLAQLQMAVDDYAGALASLERWFQLAEDPAPDAHALAGTVYAQLRRYPDAATQLSKAIDLSKEPQETWYRQLLAVYYQSSKYGPAATLLEKMIRRFPEHKDYWLQLSSVYRELGNDTQAVAVMELAHVHGLLTRESELVNLARYYLYVGLPHKAAQLLDESLEAGNVTPTADNYELLVDAWLQAREIDRALAASERALESLPHADLYLKRARLLADKEQWSDVIAAVELALAAAELGSPGKAHLLQGIAHYNLRQPAKAKSSFERAGTFADSREQAQQWTRHLSAGQAPATEQYIWAYSSQ